MRIGEPAVAPRAQPLRPDRAGAALDEAHQPRSPALPPAMRCDVERLQLGAVGMRAPAGARQQPAAVRRRHDPQLAAPGVRGCRRPQPRLLAVDVEDDRRVLRPDSADERDEPGAVVIGDGAQPGQQLLAHRQVRDAGFLVRLADARVTEPLVEPDDRLLGVQLDGRQSLITRPALRDPHDHRAEAAAPPVGLDGHPADDRLVSRCRRSARCR